jgi:hypothetical protein
MTDICPVPKIAGEDWSALFGRRAPAFASAFSGLFSDSQLFALFHLISTALLSMNCQFYGTSFQHCCSYGFPYGMRDELFVTIRRVLFMLKLSVRSSLCAAIFAEFRWCCYTRCYIFSASMSF